MRQRRSPGSKRNWTTRLSCRWGSSRRAYRSWRRLSAGVTSATRLSWAFLGLQVLLLLFVLLLLLLLLLPIRVIIAHPPRAPFLRGSSLVGGEQRRWTPVPGRHDIPPSFTISYFNIVVSITSMYFPSVAKPHFCFPRLSCSVFFFLNFNLDLLLVIGFLAE